MQNTFGSSGPAVAMRVAGDRAAFYGCRFMSFQDTLLDDTGRHYYRGCYVQGGTDFIFGNGKALFDVRPVLCGSIARSSNPYCPLFHPQTFLLPDQINAVRRSATCTPSRRPAARSRRINGRRSRRTLGSVSSGASWRASGSARPSWAGHGVPTPASSSRSATCPARWGPRAGTTGATPTNRDRGAHYSCVLKLSHACVLRSWRVLVQYNNVAVQDRVLRAVPVLRGRLQNWRKSCVVSPTDAGWSCTVHHQSLGWWPGVASVENTTYITKRLLCGWLTVRACDSVLSGCIHHF